MTAKFWIFLLGTLLLVTLYANLSVAKTLVKPPWITRPKPSARLLLKSNVTFNHSEPVPPCTAKDEVFIRNFTSGPGTRNGVTNTQLRWKNFYVLPDSAFEQWEYAIINQAMWNLWQIIPCVNFGFYQSSAKPTGDYIILIKGANNGCNSHVGRQGGRQDLNLQSPGCITVGIVMHELLHALGFYHEHSRYDRDDFITINWDNVQPAYKFAFDKMSENMTSVYGVRYNINSIMHYGERTFTNNGLPTMIAKNGQRLGDTGELQETDIEKLKLMYNC